MFADLTYEANNPDMREPLGPGDLASVSAKGIANRWRAVAGSVDKLFLLRDSLWSQQDHPWAVDGSCALMMPPNFITAVTTARHPKPMAAPAPKDDGAWTSIEPARLWGSFPVNAELTRLACRRPSGAVERRQTANARRTIAELQEFGDQLLAAAHRGGDEAVIETGAELISESDTAYFGAALRRRHVAIVMVPHGGSGDLALGKGAELPGVALSEKTLTRIEDAVVERRLQDGDVAVERFDLSRRSEWRVALDLLRNVRRPKRGGVLWLWVNGRLNPRLGEIRGEDATAYVAAFRRWLEQHDVDLSRVRFLSKPTVELPGGAAARRTLDREVRRYRALGLPMSINISAAAVKDILDR